jgi:hypothetical protein
MSLFSRDTRPEVFTLLLEGYRRMTPAQKLARVADLSAASRQMAEARIRKEHPDADDSEVRLRLGALVLGRKTMLHVFSWDPAKEGW